MRFDAFIIWGHGMKYIREIMCTLRENFEIITIRWFEIKDMPKFVDDIYSCDTYPISHLREKNKYLMRVPKEIYFVLVVNSNVREREAGSGAFRGVQCAHVIEVKNKIRKQFNPAPHNHVIHGTDYESQTEHILKVLKMQGTNYYKKKPYHLPEKVRQLKTVNVDKLRARLVGGKEVRLTDTPHYAYLEGRKEEYETYFFKYLGKKLREDHFPEAFDRLLEAANYDPIICDKSGRILDGVHRATIAKYRGEKEMKAWI